MKRTTFLLVSLLFFLAGCSKTSSFININFSEIDFSDVSHINLYNCHNGRFSFITDQEAVLDICAFIAGISGNSGENANGYYEGTYALELLNGDEEKVCAIHFGDDNVFYYDVEGEGNVIRFNLVNQTANDIVSFFSNYDTGAFDWGDKAA